MKPHAALPFRSLSILYRVATLCLCGGFLVGSLATAATTATAAEAAELTFDDLFAKHAAGRIPENLAWRPGSAELLYSWPDSTGPAHWLFDAAEGSGRLLAREAQLLAGVEGECSDLVFTPEGDRLLYTVAGDLFAIDVASGTVRRLTTTEEVEEDGPAAAPDGKHLAFVRQNDLYLLEFESGAERRLTHDGEAGVVFNGITDWVYWEEIWGREATGFWWSGDSRRIAFYHLDDHEVPPFPLVDLGPVHPVVDPQRYPKAGDPLPKVEIRVVDVVSGEVQVLDTGEGSDGYLARVHWHPDHQRLAVERLNREQTRLDVLLCSAVDGRCTLLHREEYPTWLNLGDEFTFLADGRFLWSSEKSGWKALYLHAADGQEVRRLTPEGWAVDSLDLVDEEAERFLYTAFSTGELGAAERHVFEGSLAGGEAVRLTEKEGWHRALPSASGYWLHTWSDANTPVQQAVRHRTLETVGHLPAEPASFDVAALPQWEHFTLPGPQGSRLPAQMMKPTVFDAAKKYPVLTYHYGGPASQVVKNEWSGGQRELWHRWMASRGYVVFSVDNQASRFFGKRGEDRVHRRFGEVELAGQLAGVDFLRAQPWVDGQHIGLWGWSGGGSNTLYSLFRRPGVWAAGISGAPVTDWHLYDAIWTERYFDHPADNEEGYRDSSAITYVGELADPLLLIHGTGDNNVHAQNSINLVDALIRADARFDLALYPNVSHSWKTFDDSYQRHFLRTMTEFFDRHLRPNAERREESDMTQGR